MSLAGRIVKGECCIADLEQARAMEIQNVRALLMHVKQVRASQGKALE